MIIDCHGHYTTEPAQLTRFRQAQLAALEGGTAAPELEAISDDEVRESVEGNQLRVLRERAADVLEAARAREKRETGIRERYRSGELGLDMNKMREPLAAKGLTYVEQEPPR